MMARGLWTYQTRRVQVRSDNAVGVGDAGDAGGRCDVRGVEESIATDALAMFPVKPD